MASIGDMVSSFFNPDEAYQEAEKQMRKYYQQAQGYQMPFVNNGQNQVGQLTGAENELLNPVDLENEWASKYQMSPAAQDAINKSKSAGLDAASSMGLMGSSAALNNIEKSAGQISNEDRQNFLNDLMQKYLSGIGIGKNIYNTGANTANNLGNEAMQMGSNMGQLKYGETAAPGAFFGNALSYLGNGAMDYMTGGASGAAGALSGAASGVSSGAASVPVFTG